jgi:Rod binding domain-containing protein
MFSSTAVNRIAGGTSGAETLQTKTHKAGEQFEAVLLNMVLGGVERSFAQLPGSKIEHATEAYSGMGMQALSSSLARAGGIGIAAMIAKALSKTEVRTKE